MFKGVTITKKDGDILLLIDNGHLTLRLQFNPWTFKAKDFKYSVKEERK